MIVNRWSTWASESVSCIDDLSSCAYVTCPILELFVLKDNVIDVEERRTARMRERVRSVLGAAACAGSAVMSNNEKRPVASVRDIPSILP